MQRLYARKTPNRVSKTAVRVDAKCDPWRKKDRTAIAVYNDFVGKHGVYSDGNNEIAADTITLVNILALGNRLEALKGKWKGYYSIRIYDQLRVVFRWEPGIATDVRVVDYH